MTTHEPVRPSPIPVTREEGAAFLGRDFDQAFAEKRRLEDLVWDISKFAFTAQSALLAVGVAAYRYSLESTIDLIPAAVVLLAIGFAVGLFLVWLMVRTRVYFVSVSRYINDQRAFFFRDNPLGYMNVSGFYADPSLPPFFSWSSTQNWATLLVSLFNAVEAGTLVYLCTIRHVNQVAFAASAVVLLFIVQLVAVRSYLRSREGRSIEWAVWGRKGS